MNDCKCVFLDGVPPVLTIAAVTSSPTRSSPVTFRVTASEALSVAMTSSIFAASGGTIALFYAVTGGYEITVTPSQPSVSVSIQGMANSVQDLAGNQNAVANSPVVVYGEPMD